MIELFDFSTKILALSLYSLLIGLMLHLGSYGYSKIKPMIDIWRDYWLVMLVMCLLPMTFIFIPAAASQLSVFDLSQLQFSGLQMSPSSAVNEVNTTISNNSGLTVFNLLSMLWLSVLIVGALYSLNRLKLQFKLIKGIINTATNVSAMNNYSCGQQYQKLIRLQKQSKVNILITPLVISPFVYQLRDRHMVLPQSLFQNLSEQQIDLIIRHELIHLKRHDPLMVMISHLINCLMWFNPFVRLFQKNMNWAIEASCDSLVLSQKPKLRKIYAQTMIKILREPATKVSSHMVTAFSTKTHKNLKMRIKNIMQPSHTDLKSKLKKSQLWVGVLPAILLIFMAQPQLSAAPDSEHPLAVAPAEARISSSYGKKNRFNVFRKGVDLATKVSEPIVAASAGVVSVSSDLKENLLDYGKAITTDHVSSYYSIYAHLKNRAVSEGSGVEAGQPIGHVGETDKASSPHEYLEIIKDDKQINPKEYIAF